jgi:hypothetical protein
MRKSHEPQPSTSLFEPEVLIGLYEAEHRPTHDQKWAGLTAADAAFARVAIARANEIEETDGTTARYAYLEDLADMHLAFARQKLIDELDGLSSDQTALPPAA